MAGRTVLSARMQAVADMVCSGNRVCDVGCDHGYIPIYLVQNCISPSAIAMDVRKGPLRRAGEHVRQAGLLEYITLRLSDGLAAYRPGEAQTLILAGMGGRLMQRILAREPDKTGSFEELILQPQSELKAFRRFLRETGYLISAEDMISEEGKFYPVIRAVPGDGSNTGSGHELEDRFGPVLLKRRDPVLAQYLKREWELSLRLTDRLEHADRGLRTEQRLAELLEERRFLEEALKIFGWDGSGMERK